MKILLIVDCYLLPTKSVSLMMQELGREFRHLGHSVIVVTPDDSLTAPKCISKENDVTILRIRTGKIKGARKIRRAWNEIRLSAVIWNRQKNSSATTPATSSSSTRRVSFSAGWYSD